MVPLGRPRKGGGRTGHCFYLGGGGDPTVARHVRRTDDIRVSLAKWSREERTNGKQGKGTPKYSDAANSVELYRDAKERENDDISFGENGEKRHGTDHNGLLY